MSQPAAAKTGGLPISCIWSVKRNLALGSKKVYSKEVWVTAFLPPRLWLQIREMMKDLNSWFSEEIRNEVQNDRGLTPFPRRVRKSPASMVRMVTDSQVLSNYYRTEGKQHRTKGGHAGLVSRSSWQWARRDHCPSHMPYKAWELQYGLSLQDTSTFLQFLQHLCFHWWWDFPQKPLDCPSRFSSVDRA